LSCEVLATPFAASRLRHDLSAWLRAQHLAVELVEAVVLAGYEALANAAEHAYQRFRSGGSAAEHVGTVRLRAWTEPGRIEIRVGDHGSWRTPRRVGERRGRGLVLMRALADEVTVQTGATGTTVTLSWLRPGLPG
jgi:anti-sigma regulatory factor (Ser/Thr protein kinase)